MCVQIRLGSGRLRDERYLSILELGGLPAGAQDFLGEESTLAHHNLLKLVGTKQAFSLKGQLLKALLAWEFHQPAF